MNRKSGTAAVVIAGAMCLVTCSRQPEHVNAESVPSEEQVVAVAKVRRADISSETTLTAEFEPFQEVDVMSKVAGYVRSIKVDLGDRVREGQLLALLEVPEMQDDLAKAAASIEQSDAEIAAARDELVRSESAHRIAHLSFQRILDVSKREPGLVPQQEVDEAQSRDQVAEAQIAAAKSKLRVSERRTQVARADESRVRTMRNYISITAPFTGTVTKRYANTGSMIQAGTASQSQAMPVVRLSQDNVLRLSLPVPESMVTAVRVGAPVQVQVSSLNRTFAGKIARFAARVDKATRTMTTEVDVPNPSGVLMPGMYAQVMLPLQEHSNAVSVPLEAVERSGSGARVYQVAGTGEVRVVPVKLGIESATRSEILSGVHEGDQVVVGRRAGLKEGERVRTRLTESTERAETRKGGN